MADQRRDSIYLLWIAKQLSGIVVRNLPKTAIRNDYHRNNSRPSRDVAEQHKKFSPMEALIGKAPDTISSRAGAYS